MKLTNIVKLVLTLFGLFILFLSSLQESQIAVQILFTVAIACALLPHLFISNVSVSMETTKDAPPSPPITITKKVNDAGRRKEEQQWRKEEEENKKQDMKRQLMEEYKKRMEALETVEEEDDEPEEEPQQEPKPEPQSDEYPRCNECGAAFTSKAALFKHLKGVHYGG